MSIPIQYACLPLLVWLFLTIDLLIEVDSLRALFSNFFFWLYWLIYSVAAETALYFLGNATNGTISGLPKPVLILIAIVGTTTILQSLTFKIGGRRLIDLSRYLEDYRGKVLASSGKLVRQQEDHRVMRQSRSMLKKVQYRQGEPQSEERMKKMYAEVMLFGSRKPATVIAEIAKIEKDCEETGASFGNAVSQRISRADPEWVKDYLAN